MIRALRRLADLASLRTKLVAALVLLSGAGLATAGVTSLLVLERQLLDRVDAQLATTAGPGGRQPPGSPRRQGDGPAGSTGDPLADERRPALVTAFYLHRSGTRNDVGPELRTPGALAGQTGPDLAGVQLASRIGRDAFTVPAGGPGPG
jgi:hypothetical protein